MIAPIRETEEPSRSERMRQAHRLVASTLLKEPSYPADKGPAVPAWQAWTFAVWAVAVAAICIVWLAGLF
jgi:hypothetical protein